MECQFNLRAFLPSLDQTSVYFLSANKIQKAALKSYQLHEMKKKRIQSFGSLKSINSLTHANELSQSAHGESKFLMHT